MRLPLLFICFFFMLIPGQGAIQVYIPAEALVTDQVSTYDQKTDKETRRALRQEFKKARKAAKAAEGESSPAIAIIGLVSSVLSFILLFVANTGILGLLFFVAGLTLSIIAFSWIKNGRMAKRHQWMPITSIVVAGVQVLLTIFAIAFVIGILSLFG